MNLIICIFNWYHIFILYLITPCFLHKFWSFNSIENAVYYRSDDDVSKYVFGFEYKLNGEEIWSVVEMAMILNFLEFEKSCLRKYKIITTSTTAYISSAFKSYPNPCTYLETASLALSYTAFSDSLNNQNLCKMHRIMMYASNYVIPE